LLAAYLGLGLALRLWRDAFPVVEGGTAILAHPFERRFAHPSQQPYRNFFQAIRAGSARELDLVEEAERSAAETKAIAAYRHRRAHHPLPPLPTGARARRRSDASAPSSSPAVATTTRRARWPTHGIGAAVQMAEGRAGRPLRIGFLLAPPYSPCVRS
jgi:hypothetical protein